MARARAAASSPTSRRKLDVDPGPPPQQAGAAGTPDDEARAAAAAAAVPPEVPPAPSIAEEWKLSTVRSLVTLPCLALHWTVGRGGPPDIFIPDAVTRDEMAEPAVNWLNGSMRLRALARFSDGLAFAAVFGGFVFSETVELARYRAAGDTARARTADDDLAGLGVTATRAGDERSWQPPPAPPQFADREPADDVATPPGVRAWRPPRIAADEARS